MSDVVWLHGPIRIPAKNIDGGQLAADIAAVEERSDHGNLVGEKEFIIWWFLGAGAIEVTTDEVVWDTQKARSDHTYTSLADTAKFLSRYVPAELTIKLTIKLTDQDDVAAKQFTFFLIGQKRQVASVKYDSLFVAEERLA